MKILSYIAKKVTKISNQNEIDYKKVKEVLSHKDDDVYSLIPPLHLKERIKLKYLSLSNDFLFSFINLTNKVARRLIENKGLNPDVVLFPKNLNDALLYSHSRYRPFSFSNNWSRKHFNESHPILSLRKKIIESGGLKDASEEQLDRTSNDLKNLENAVNELLVAKNNMKTPVTNLVEMKNNEMSDTQTNPVDSKKRGGKIINLEKSRKRNSTTKKSKK